VRLQTWLLLRNKLYYHWFTNKIIHFRTEETIDERRISVNSFTERRVEEEDVDDVEEPADTEEPAQNQAMPAPRVKIGANGEIILDEKSLVIETTESKRGRKALMSSAPILEEGMFRSATSGKKRTKAQDWSPIGKLLCPVLEHVIFMGIF